MSPSMNTTVSRIWKKLTNKEYRDSFVASNIANTVSSQIFALREQRNWTQKDLAQKAGMAQSRISSLEDPNLDNFEIITLKRLASAFDVAVIVRFAPFSELANWAVSLTTEKLTVPAFANDFPETTTSNVGSSFTIGPSRIGVPNAIGSPAGQILPGAMYSAEARISNWTTSTASAALSHSLKGESLVKSNRPQYENSLVWRRSA